MGRNRKKTGSGAVGAPPAARPTVADGDVIQGWTVTDVNSEQPSFEVRIPDIGAGIMASLMRGEKERFIMDVEDNRNVGRDVEITIPGAYDEATGTLDYNAVASGLNQWLRENYNALSTGGRLAPEVTVTPSADTTPVVAPETLTPSVRLRPNAIEPEQDRNQKLAQRVERELGRLESVITRSILGDGTFNQVEMRRLLAERTRAKELEGLASVIDQSDTKIARLTRQLEAANVFERPRIATRLQDETGKRARFVRDYQRRAQAPISFGEEAQAQRRIDVVRGMIENRDLRGRSDIARELLSDSETRVESGARAPRTRSARSRLL